MRVSAILLLLAGCSSAAPTEPLEVTAYEGRGIEQIPGEIIIPDSRKRVPAAVAKCGVGTVETINATDGVVLFRFSATAAETNCIRKALPAGTQLRSLTDSRVIRDFGERLGN